MSVKLRWEQCCESANCTKPACHGVLCAACFRAANPARRAVELLSNTPEPSQIPVRNAHVSDEGAAWLARLWAA